MKFVSRLCQWVSLFCGLIVAHPGNGYCEQALAMVSDTIYGDISHFKQSAEDISPSVRSVDDITPFSPKGLTQSFGGSGKEEGISIIKTTDGFFLIGTSQSSEMPGFNGGLSDVYVVKINGRGQKLWERFYGTDQTDRAVSAVGLPDGGCLIVGTTLNINLFDNEELILPGSADIHIWKTSSQGTLEWERMINNEEAIYHPDDYGRAVTLASGTKAVVLGHSWGNTDIWVNVIDIKTGVTVNEKRINTHESIYDPKFIMKTGDGGYIITGECGLNAFAMKLNETMDQDWSTVFTGNSLDSLFAATELKDGYLFVGGTSSTARPYSSNKLQRIVTTDKDVRDQEMYFVKTDKNGKSRARFWEYPAYDAPVNTEWQIGFGWLESGWSDISLTNSGSEFENDCAFQVAVKPDGTCLVMGTGTWHENGTGVTGKGQQGKIETGALLMSIDPEIKARDSIKGDNYFTWETQFKEECLQWKKIHTEMETVRSFAEIDEGYLLFGSDKNNDMMLIAIRNDGSKL